VRKTTHDQRYGIQPGPGKLADLDLDLTDDISFTGITSNALQDMTTGLQNNGMNVSDYGSVQIRLKQ